MIERAAATKAAYAHLKEHDPAFMRLTTADRFKAVQQHIKRLSTGT
jgi:hypothetical protein